MSQFSSITDLFTSRNKRLDGYCYKLDDSQQNYGMDFSMFGDPDMDEARMSMWVVFADGRRRDGVGDLLDVSGIDTSRHRMNPVVLFDHGKQIPLPIALTEEPDSKVYTVVLEPEIQQGKFNAFFYQGKGIHGVGKSDEYDHALFCEQLYDLAVKRYIRAGSIGYQVKQAVQLAPDYQTGTPQGLHLQKVLMLEGSLVVMPANQDTVRKALCLPRVCGKPLSPMLVKSLSSYCPEAKAQIGYEGKGRGTNPEIDKVRSDRYGHVVYPDPPYYERYGGGGHGGPNYQEGEEYKYPRATRDSIESINPNRFRHTRGGSADRTLSIPPHGSATNEGAFARAGYRGKPPAPEQAEQTTRKEPRKKSLRAKYSVKGRGTNPGIDKIRSDVEGRIIYDQPHFQERYGGGGYNGPNRQESEELKEGINQGEETGYVTRSSIQARNVHRFDHLRGGSGDRRIPSPPHESATNEGAFARAGYRGKPPAPEQAEQTTRKEPRKKAIGPNKVTKPSKIGSDSSRSPIHETEGSGKIRYRDPHYTEMDLDTDLSEQPNPEYENRGEVKPYTPPTPPVHTPRTRAAGYRLRSKYGKAIPKTTEEVTEEKIRRHADAVGKQSIREDQTHLHRQSDTSHKESGVGRVLPNRTARNNVKATTEYLGGKHEFNAVVSSSADGGETETLSTGKRLRIKYGAKDINSKKQGRAEDEARKEKAREQLKVDSKVTGEAYEPRRRVLPTTGTEIGQDIQPQNTDEVYGSVFGPQSNPDFVNRRVKSEFGTGSRGRVRTMSEEERLRAVNESRLGDNTVASMSQARDPRGDKRGSARKHGYPVHETVDNSERPGTRVTSIRGTPTPKVPQADSSANTTPENINKTSKGFESRRAAESKKRERIADVEGKETGTGPEGVRTYRDILAQQQAQESEHEEHPVYGVGAQDDTVKRPTESYTSSGPGYIAGSPEQTTRSEQKASRANPKTNTKSLEISTIEQSKNIENITNTLQLLIKAMGDKYV